MKKILLFVLLFMLLFNHVILADSREYFSRIVDVSVGDNLVYVATDLSNITTNTLNNDFNGKKIDYLLMHLGPPNKIELAEDGTQQWFYRTISYFAEVEMQKDFRGIVFSIYNSGVIKAHILLYDFFRDHHKTHIISKEEINLMKKYMNKRNLLGNVIYTVKWEYSEKATSFLYKGKMLDCSISKNNKKMTLKQCFKDYKLPILLSIKGKEINYYCFYINISKKICPYLKFNYIDGEVLGDGEYLGIKPEVAKLKLENLKAKYNIISTHQIPFAIKTPDGKLLINNNDLYTVVPEMNKKTNSFDFAVFLKKESLKKLYSYTKNNVGFSRESNGVLVCINGNNDLRRIASEFYWGLVIAPPKLIYSIEDALAFSLSLLHKK